MTVKNQKNLIRKQISCIQNNIDDNAFSTMSASIKKNILYLSCLETSDAILSFMPMRAEPDFVDLYQKFTNENKIVAIPKIKKVEKNSAGTMDFYVVQGYPKDECLQKGPFGILEPISTLPIFEVKRNMNVLVFVPGVAFTAKGHRVGHGKGFYDLYLCNLRDKIKKLDGTLVLVGVCFSFQILPSIPIDCYDIDVDYIVTEKSIMRTSENFSF